MTSRADPAERRELFVFAVLLFVLAGLIAWAVVVAPGVADVEPHIVTSTTLPIP